MFNENIHNNMLSAPQNESFFCRKKKVLINFLLLVFCRVKQSTLCQRRLKYLYKDVKFVPINLNKYKRKSLGQIQPELYKCGKISPIEEDHEIETNGKIHFSAKYNKELEILIIKLFRANDLPAKNMHGFCDPYVKIFLPPNKKKKVHSKVRPKSRNPIFNETFTFSVNSEEVRTKAVEFLVYDFNYFRKNRLIGHATFKKLDEVVDLQQEIGYTMDIISTINDNEDIGKINICLCYLPVASRLIITIFKCNKLKPSYITGKADPYVKIYLFLQDKRIKRKKTKIKHGTSNPIFNEAFIFEVSQQQITDVTFVLRILDHDRISRNDVMGYVVTGPKYFIEESKTHWKEVLNKPRQHTSQWYHLTEFLPISIPLPKNKAYERPKWLKNVI